MSVDPERLRRALHLDAERDGEGWRVHGHHVTADGCDCRDHEVRGTTVTCKHRLAVRLAALDAELGAALRQLVPMRPTTTVPRPPREPAPGR